MPQSKQCPKCSASMAEGFVVDATHGAYGVSNWVEGAPLKSMWTGVKLSGKPRAEIATWRCNRCGFLEHYAPQEPDRSQEKATRNQAMMVVLVSLAITLLILGAVLLAKLA